MPTRSSATQSIAKEFEGVRTHPFPLLSWDDGSGHLPDEALGHPNRFFLRNLGEVKRKFLTMRTRFRISFLGILLLGFSQPSVNAGVIFDNTTTPNGSKSFTALQIGEEVTVTSAANVTDLEIGVTQQGVAGTADLQAFLYENNGAGGSPGALLWSSPLKSKVALTGGNDLIAFAVPGIAVPSTFTWTIQISNTSPISAGLPAFDPPTVGTIDHGWFGSPGNWGNLDGIGTSSHFMARISANPAVPEPACVLPASVGIGLGLLWSLRKRISNRTR